MSDAVAPQVAYFSMEIGLDPAVPTYAGGLGVLAGDTLRSAADLGLPMVAVTFCYRRGYFRQRLDETGRQREESPAWDPVASLEPVSARVSVEVSGRPVHLSAWRYPVRGAGGEVVPVYLLDSDLPENDSADRSLTADLYGGDATHRLRQETVLGVGGVRLLRALGCDAVRVFHLNEGHAALILLALADESAAHGTTDPEELRRTLRARCVFTTHTPVAAGHDRFPEAVVESVLSPAWRKRLADLGQSEGLNMTELAIACSRYVNGVALRHGQVTRGMYPATEVRSITNGVHVASWASPPFQRLFDRHAPGWRHDSFALRNLLAAPAEDVWDAHVENKQALIAELVRRGHGGFDRDALTLVWARRATAYKRPQLLFDDPDRLKAMARYIGPVQIVCAGKAHPQDEEGKSLIRRIVELSRELKGRIPVAFLENYDMALARLLCAGGDVWVNTPRPPLEASGTSGMKAAVNGVPSLSVLDGWWIEGHLEGQTGWAVGEYVADPEKPANDRKVAHALYEKLSKVVLPCYFRERDDFVRIMRNAVAHNASFFNTHRMILEYAAHAYGLDDRVE